VRILQEVSATYKTMYFWEADPKRTAAMMKRRVQMLTPLVEALNPKVYPAFCRQLCFEAAEVYQELYELKARVYVYDAFVSGARLGDRGDEPLGGDVRRAARCNELARKSLQYYGTFVDSFHLDGKVPDRIEKDSCRAYLTARLNRARLRTKMHGLGRDESVREHREALREYEWILDYGARHAEVTSPDIGMAQELQLCREMAEMMPSKLDRMAAGRPI